MSYFYKSIDKQAVKGFICEDLRVFGIKVPKLEKLEKKSVAESESQSGSDIQIHSVDARKTSSSRMQVRKLFYCKICSYVTLSLSLSIQVLV